MSHGDPWSQVTQRMGSLPPSRITEVKMVIENRPTMGLITAQLILFQKGKQKKKKATHNKQKRGVQLLSHPGKHKELGCWPSPSKLSNTGDVSHVTTTTGRSEHPVSSSIRAPSLLAGVAGQAGRAQSMRHLQAVGMRGAMKYWIVWRGWENKPHVGGVSFGGVWPAWPPRPPLQAACCPLGQSTAGAAVNSTRAMLSPPYPGGKSGRMGSTKISKELCQPLP